MSPGTRRGPAPQPTGSDPTVENTAAAKQHRLTADGDTNWLDLASTARAKALAARQRGLERALADARRRQHRADIALIELWRAEVVQQRHNLRGAA